MGEGEGIEAPDLIILFLGDRTGTIMPQDIALVRQYRWAPTPQLTAW